MFNMSATDMLGSDAKSTSRQAWGSTAAFTRSKMRTQLSLDRSFVEMHNSKVDVKDHFLTDELKFVLNSHINKGGSPHSHHFSGTMLRKMQRSPEGLLREKYSENPVSALKHMTRKR
jgi:hypothetical protein